MTAYVSRDDRSSETEPAEMRVAQFALSDAPMPCFDKCPVCRASQRRHSGDGWELHQEELRRRIRKAQENAALNSAIPRWCGNE